MTCEVEGKPPPVITWLKDNNPVTIDGNRMTVTPQPSTSHRTVISFTINTLTRKDEGNYSCRVNNSLDELTSTAALLTVNCKYLLY
jgi:S-methylmethionine-dependent homocysteine/selenocysteine methylase